MEALPAIVAGHPGVRIELAGPGEPPEAALRAIDELPGVTWLGWLDEERKADAFGRADVLVLPSISEGMPNAMLEAMANSRAVVASAVGGVPDVLTDGVEGLLVPAGDPARLAEAVCRVLGDAELAPRLGAAGRARAERLTRGRSGHGSTRCTRSWCERAAGGFHRRPPDPAGPAPPATDRDR